MLPSLPVLVPLRSNRDFGPALGRDAGYMYAYVLVGTMLLPVSTSRLFPTIRMPLTLVTKKAVSTYLVVEEHLLAIDSLTDTNVGTCSPRRQQ